MPADELNVLIDAAETHLAGIDLAQARKLLPRRPSRTLQRRLSRLVRVAQLMAIGKGTARRYLVPQLTATRTPPNAHSLALAPISLLPLLEEARRFFYVSINRWLCANR